MNYKQAIEFMYNSLPMYQRVGKAAYKNDLNNIILLDNYLNNPHKHFNSIHIAGTNGKGSVAHIVASIFQESGYKTGLYTSPHLIDYRERIRINGQKISKDFVTNFINTNYSFIQIIKPSFFEMSVALAFEYFKQNSVDIAIIEVGMGGRLDSTNIITPLLSIITNIGMDHTYYLGNCIEKIAREKAGIIKQNIPVIIGETNENTEKIFLNIAKNNNSKIFFADKQVVIEPENESFYYKLKDYAIKNVFKPDLIGNYQKTNYCTAIFSVYKLREKYINITNKTILRGIENVGNNTGLRGRWEILSECPRVICDTAHNKEGLQIVLNQIKSLNYKNLHFILGFVNDKNIFEILSIFPKDAFYYFAQAKIPRALSSELLKKEADKLKLSGKSYNEITQAYSNAKKNAQKDDIIYVGGSNFIVGELLESIELNS